MPRRSFPPATASIREARAFVLDRVGDLDDDARDAVILVVSELTTNCVLHARTDFTVDLARSRRLIRVEVRDAGGGTPVVRPVDLQAQSGRGLQIVEDLSTAWGVRREQPRGKTVWAELTAISADGPAVPAAAAPGPRR